MSDTALQPKIDKLFRNKQIIESGFPLKINTFRFINLAMQMIRNIGKPEDGIFITHEKFKDHYPSDAGKKNIKKIMRDIAQDIEQNNWIEYPTRRFKYLKITLFSAQSLEPNGIFLKFNQDILKKILTDNHYKKQSQLQINQHSDIEGSQLYCLLDKYRQKGTVERSVDEIIIMLGLNKNIQTKNITKVIKRKIKIINDKNDIHADFETINKGRKVTGYRFQVTPNQDDASINKQISPNNKKISLKQSLAEINIPKGQINEIIKRNNESALEEAILITKETIKNNAITGSNVGFLIFTLKRLST